MKIEFNRESEIKYNKENTIKQLTKERGFNHKNYNLSNKDVENFLEQAPNGLEIVISGNRLRNTKTEAKRSSIPKMIPYYTTIKSDFDGNFNVVKISNIDNIYYIENDKIVSFIKEISSERLKEAQDIFTENGYCFEINKDKKAIKEEKNSGTELHIITEKEDGYLVIG